MTSEEGEGPRLSAQKQAAGDLGAAERRPLSTPEEVRKAFLAPPSDGGTDPVAPLPARPRPQGSPTSGILEFGLAVTGLGLSAFMVMHMSLLSSVMLGEETFDRVASFMERYYLLQATAPLLITGIVVHVVFALRKIPVSLRQQKLLLERSRAMRHLDTFAWVVQLVTALVIVALVSIHLRNVLTDAPIQAAKSGARVQTDYLWFDTPFIIAVYSHMFIGLYRILIKWGVNHRGLLRGALITLTAVAFGMGALITLALYRVGSSS